MAFCSAVSGSEVAEEEADGEAGLFVCSAPDEADGGGEEDKDSSSGGWKAEKKQIY